jgi:hypothetical protein
MATPPKLTAEQRQKALEKAKVVRTKRAKLRAEVAAGKKGIKAVLNKKDDPIVGRMKVKSLINSFPGCGAVKTEKIMNELKIAENRRVQGLGSRQVEGLIKYLA